MEQGELNCLLIKKIPKDDLRVKIFNLLPSGLLPSALEFYQICPLSF